MEDQIEYVSEAGYRGVLYDWHDDPYCGRHYQMSIRNPEGEEVLHSYNAGPNSLESLKKAVNDYPDIARLFA